MQLMRSIPFSAGLEGSAALRVWADDCNLSVAAAEILLLAVGEGGLR